jgi:DNA polymerase III epsilon subunit-like protein
MEFVFDTETTGLPLKRGYAFDSPKNLASYENARLVSISWIVSQRHSPVKQAYYIIRPDGFEVSPESTAIHGISHAQAEKEGVPIHIVLEEMKLALQGCTSLVAHNIAFDVHILQSEAYRYGDMELYGMIQNMSHICTMLKGKEVMAVKRYPKLEALYKHLYGEEITHAHNAQYDTLHCYKCYTKMFPVDRRIFFFGDTMVKLTDQQLDIVDEDLDTHMIVIACAGSGKTTTMLCRIKHLLDEGVEERSIMLTAFTRDAANDMKSKLFAILGYKPAITVNTIDSISKMYYERKKHNLTSLSKESRDSFKDVGEYNYVFLEAIRNDPTIIEKYKYLFVDEFQDINDVQFQIFHEFVKQGTILFGVGDDAQNIYTFRGSNVRYILDFQSLIADSLKFNMKFMMKFLTYNYRSTGPIIDFANAIMEQSPTSIPKTMVAGTAFAGAVATGTAKEQVVIKPSVRYFQSRFQQDTYIAETIENLISEEQVAPHNIAVISPVNQPLFMIEELLTKKNVPNVYLDGKSDVKTAKKPWHVSLCTIHKSKGLEWDIVFMIGVSDEMFPRSKSKVTEIEESRRLFYVGVTRAKHELYLLYTTLVQNEPFVSRFIASIPRTLCTYTNMSDLCFAGSSELDFAIEERSVTKLIEKLDGQDYQHLKRCGIIPEISVTDINKRKRKLYESFTYLPIIQQQDLYSDFGIFLEKLIHREVAIARGDPALCTDKHAIMCLANVKMTPDETNVYMQYKRNFKMNMKHIEELILRTDHPDDELYVHKKEIQTRLEQHAKFIQHIHMKEILSILRKVRDNARKYKIQPRDVPIFTANFLPQGFETSMQRALQVYTDMSIPTKNCIEYVWEVSKCQKIVTEWRRRLLYKNAAIFHEVFDAYKPLYDRIKEFFIPMLSLETEASIKTSQHLEISDEGGIYGELDMRIGSTIIDYKCSISDDIQLQWILQLLCYKVLSDHRCHRADSKIETIGIFNPLRGWYVDINVASWDKHNELVSYLLAKREGALPPTDDGPTTSD